MAIIGMILLVNFVPLILIVAGLRLINDSSERIFEVLQRDERPEGREEIADSFFTSPGVSAPWDWYVDDFLAENGRLPLRDEIKVPCERAGDVTRLMAVCRQRGIAWWLFHLSAA
jgi:hypothetical protein